MTKFWASVVRPLALLSLVVVLSACAATKQAALSTPTAGSAFLPDPSLLRPGTTGQVDQVYRNPAANWGS